MYLKRLEIQGFKSFANKVEINFESGITGIVGPNGSGKSNISDSIRWVLGEQSAKALRGAKMEDVIFSGTVNLKPLSMAEVSITFDNSCKTLPIDYNEITITRRVYRSGESEYYLNKSLCRLKDIRELLMDTGIGKDGYSIIGQGKIEEILSNRPEDRRQIFEEAAGIVKYRTRKEETEKKLSSTEENLLRVLDILHELKNQLKPLEKQSNKAKQFKIFKDRLMKLEVNVFVREIDKLDDELKLICEQINLIKKSLQEQQKEKDFHLVQAEEVENLIKNYSVKISEKQNEYYITQKYIEKIEGQINLEKERYNNYSLNIETINMDISKIINSQNKNNIKLENKLKKLEEININENKIKDKLKNKDIQYKSLKDLNNQATKDVEYFRTFIIDALNEISDKKSELKSLKTLLDTMEQRMEQVQLEQKDYKKRYLQKDKELNHLNSNLYKLKKHKEITENIIIDKSNKKNNLQKKLENTLREINELQNAIRNKKTRENVIKDMEMEREGFSKSVKNILSACNQNKDLGSGVFGVVADLIDVPKGFEISIETALGFAMQYIVSENEKVGKKLIDYLKRHNLGRITVLPLTTIGQRNITREEMKIIENFKDAKVAYNIVKFDKKFENIISNLLSRVLIVPNLDKAIEIAKLVKYKFKIVTIDGDILNIGGSLTGGSTFNKNISILSRRRELEELENEIANITNKLNNKIILNTKLENEIKVIVDEIEKLNTNLQEDKINMATLKTNIEQCIKEKDEIERLCNYTQNEMEQIEGINKENTAKYLLLEDEIKKIELNIENTRSNISYNEKQLTEKKLQLDNISNLLTQYKVEFATIEEQKKAIIQNIEDLQQSIRNTETSIKNKHIELRENNKLNKTTEEKIKKLYNEHRTMLSNLKKYEEELQQYKEYKKLQEDKDIEVKGLLKQVETVLLELQEGNYKLDVKRTRLEMQQQNLYKRLWDEYELTYKEATKLKDENIDITAVNKEVKMLKSKIKDLGNVNLDSILEYEKIKERYDFLKKQQEDLSGAKQSLIKVIKDMEETMQKQFIEQFEIIKQNFNDVFIKLFGGGKASLTLDDKDNVLECGIDIVAQPPGKKLQTISLLSGGEKALTAISLLFGILLAKPSPFCILDEIEAALDESNVYRFAEFLEELSENTQFIVVTHRKGTMESAHALYGVTMQDEGVSTLVSVKLTDDEETSNIYTSA